MATLICELRGKAAGVSKDSSTRKRRFAVRQATKTESEAAIILAAGVVYGSVHPNNIFLFCTDIQAEQDPGTWWLWTVTCEYSTPEGEQGDETQNANPDNDPTLKLPEISYHTESIMVAAKGEIDASGNITKAIVTTAGEPYDPHPEDELDILFITIVRWLSPSFSLTTYQKFQNAVNDATFTFGDKTFPIGSIKIRTRISPTENVVLPSTGARKYYRRFEHTLACHPDENGWDIHLLDWGTYYKDAANPTGYSRFIDVENREFGMLDGNGFSLPDTATTPVFNHWKNKKRVDFSLLSLPSGP